MNPTLSVFIPAFNEEQNLAGCIEVVQEKMDALGVSLEILVVDDGSTDSTGALADRLAAANPRLHVVHHPANLGIGEAFRTAASRACGEWLILIPADLALDPGELFRYIAAAPQADIVVGLRSCRSDYTLLRRIISWTNIRLIQGLFGMEERQFQYISMYRMEVLSRLKIEYTRSAFFLAEVLIKAKALGFRLVEVEILYAPRLRGRPTGAKLVLVIRTVVDIVRFWLRWVCLGRKDVRMIVKDEAAHALVST
ncbi:MAG: glycosyltransferase family 2 protein [Omnitrophica WOR_2 bacterium]